MLDVLTPLRRRLAAASLLAFVGLLIAQDLIDPTDRAGSNADRLGAAVDHPNRLLAATVLLFLSSVAMLPSIVAVLGAVHDRGRWLARIGAGLAVLGALGHVGVATYYAALSGLPGGDPEEMVAFLDRLDSSATAGVVLVPAIAGFALGVFLLGFALARSRVLPAWAAAITFAAVVLEAAQIQPWAPMHLAQTVAVVPFTWLAIRLLDPLGARAPQARRDTAEATP